MPKLIIAISILFTFLFPSLSQAHVKWFAPYDTSEAPMAIKYLITNSDFLWVGMASVMFVFFVSLMDVSTKGINQWIRNCRRRVLKVLPESIAYLSMRKTLIIFFSCIWAIGGIVLTPELQHSSDIIYYIQAIIIASLLTPKTSKFSGVGIILLWTYGVMNYGFFHLTDYIIFLGIAIFMIIGGNQEQQKTSSWAFFILYVSISCTLQWASVEKWTYPEWTYPILQEREYLTMGLDKDIFMIIAGFVEFSLAFLLIATFGSGFIITTMALATVFILAIIDFGKIDAIGHLAIIVCLFLMALKGPGRINSFFARLHSNSMVNATTVTGIYILSLMTFMVSYGCIYHINNAM